MAKEFKMDIIEKISTFERSGGYNLELRYISWNGNEPKYDIRTWKQNDDGTEKCGKGITLTEEELQHLGESIARYFGN